jgi:serine protease
LISGVNKLFFYHGTGVLGEILMVDNQKGGVGIATKGNGRVVSEWRSVTDTTRNIPAAILDAITHMSFGDVLLLESQEYDPVGGRYKWPVEIVDANYDAIRLATALGITVIEAGCNGSFDLDPYVNLAGKKIFDRSSGDFRDSGAIMVGAGSSASPHTRMWFSNYGSRIDCYAWGENVDTTYTNDPAGNDNTLYTGTFDGTSAASPIVTGAAMIVQGLAKSIGNQIDPSFEFKLSPLQMRRILTTDGTASSNPTTDKIGVMPDLKRIIDGRLINLVPDLYIRDQIGDIGNTTTRVVSASPDIIVRQQAVGDADVAFGANSGTVNNAALSQEVLSGRDHSIYIRALNRGGSPATSATATVYWSPPATLVTPNLWNRIGAAALPAVPVGRVLAVSPRLAWAASRVPSTGHYCFVAIAGATDDPSPNLPNNFPDWARFVQNNNNVAWRNFNVIPAPPSTGPRGYHVFPFNIPGAFDAPRRFAIKALGSLPRTSGVLLKLPLALARALDITLQEKQIRGYNAIIPLLPFTQQDIGEGILPVGSLAKCELHIRVPLDTYKLNGQFDFAIAQEWEGLEVGRLTYRFGPEAVVSDGKGGCGGHGKCDCGCHHGCY